MDFGEPEHIGMLRESIRRMLERHAPREQMAKWDAEDKVPRALMDKIRDLGVCGMTMPEEYGGTGRDILATMVTVEELSRRSMVIGTLLPHECLLRQHEHSRIRKRGTETASAAEARQRRIAVRLRAVGAGCRLGSRQRLDPRRAPGRQGHHQRQQALVLGRRDRRLHLCTRPHWRAGARDTRTCPSCSFRRPPRA